jgi:hypothetical protein
MNLGRCCLDAIRGVIVAAFAWCTFQAFGDLLPFPLSANQQGYVLCLEKPNLVYDIYLPPAYSTNGPALPILYTFNPDGGGMVTSFKPVCSNLNIICVGIMGSQNYGSTAVFMRESAAVTRDIRRRVLFDPTAEFAGGFSGGGLASYVFSRFRAQHVAGAFEMAGWMGRGGGYPTYQTTDRVLTNLLVARAMGLSDGGGWVMVPDSNYLACCGAVFHDEYFGGGHEVPPDSVKSSCLAWLVSQRIPADLNDQSNAGVQASDWRARIAAGDQETVLRECVAALMGHPRSWSALEAQLILDDLMADESSFRSLAVHDLASGDLASDLFYYLARGSGDLLSFIPLVVNPYDGPRYRSALKALTGITGVNGDRAGDIRALLQKHSYPAPILRCSADAALGQMNLWFSKDTPGLDCFLESRTDLITNSWQQLVLPVVDTSTAWSTKLDFPPDSNSEFYRLRTTPSAGVSPPWPGAWMP